MGAVRIEHVHDARCGRAHPARVYPQSRLRATGIKSLVSLDFTKPRHVTLRAKLALKRHRPWLCAAGVTRLLIPVSFKLLRGHTRAGMRASAASSTDVLSADSVLGEKNNRFLVTFCRSAKSYPPLAAEALALKRAKKQRRWIPAFAGMTSSERRAPLSPQPSPPPAGERELNLDSPFRGNDEQ